MQKTSGVVKLCLKYCKTFDSPEYSLSYDRKTKVAFSFIQPLNKQHGPETKSLNLPMWTDTTL